MWGWRNGRGEGSIKGIRRARRCARISVSIARSLAPGRQSRAPRPNKLRKGTDMRWLKFTAAGQTTEQASWGLVEGDRVTTVNGDPFGEWQRGTQSHALRYVKIALTL